MKVTHARSSKRESDLTGLGLNVSTCLDMSRVLGPRVSPLQRWELPWHGHFSLPPVYYSSEENAPGLKVAGADSNAPFWGIEAIRYLGIIPMGGAIPPLNANAQKSTEGSKPPCFGGDGFQLACRRRQTVAIQDQTAPLPLSRQSGSQAHMYRVAPRIPYALHSKWKQLALKCPTNPSVLKIR